MLAVTRRASRCCRGLLVHCASRLDNYRLRDSSESAPALEFPSLPLSLVADWKAAGSLWGSSE